MPIPIKLRALYTVQPLEVGRVVSFSLDMKPAIGEELIATDGSDVLRERVFVVQVEAVADKSFNARVVSEVK